MFFWCFLAFLMIQWLLAVWSLVLLPFLNPAWTSGSSHFTYYWSLPWRILSITLLACEMSAIVQQFEHSLALPFFESEWKLAFSSLVATAEFPSTARSTQPMRNWWGGTYALGNNLLAVTAVGVPAHRTPDLARPTLNVSLSLFMSPSPSHGFGHVIGFSHWLF